MFITTNFTKAISYVHLVNILKESYHINFSLLFFYFYLILLTIIGYLHVTQLGRLKIMFLHLHFYMRILYQFYIILQLLFVKLFHKKFQLGSYFLN